MKTERGIAGQQVFRRGIEQKCKEFAEKGAEVYTMG